MLQVLTAGGGNGDSRPIDNVPGVPALADAELYDPLARAWTTVPPMSVARVDHQVLSRGYGTRGWVYVSRVLAGAPYESCAPLCWLKHDVRAVIPNTPACFLSIPGAFLKRSRMLAEVSVV